MSPLLALWLVGAPAGPPMVCVGLLEAVGLDGAAVGAELEAAFSEAGIALGDETHPACRKLRARGYIEVRVLRMGGTVVWRLQVLGKDAVTPVASRERNESADGFIDGGALAADVAAVVAALGIPPNWADTKTLRATPVSGDLPEPQGPAPPVVVATSPYESWALGTAIAGGVSLVTAGVLQGVTIYEYDQLKGGAPDVERRIALGEGAQTGAIIAFTVGVCAAAAAVILWWLDPT